MEKDNGERWEAYQKICSSSDQTSSSSYAGALDAQAFIILKNAGRAPRIATKSTRESLDIQIGEIIAWRCWVIGEDGILQSCYKSVKWFPGESLLSYNGINNIGISGEGRGIHAFKSKGAALKYSLCFPTIAIGQVSMWGEMVEFEDGWHAEYGKVHSLKYIPSELLVLMFAIFMPLVILVFSFIVSISFSIISLLIALSISVAVVYTVQFFRLRKLKKLYNV